MAIQMGKGKAAAAPAGKGKTATAAKGGGEKVSLRPSDQVNEGLKDDFDATLTSAIFTLDSPPNYNAGDNIPLFIKAELTEEDGTVTEQFWSAGDSKKFQPSDDGLSAVRVSGSGGLGQATNAAAFFRSLVDAGFPEDKLMDLESLQGTLCHWKRIALARKGLVLREGQKESTVLAVEKILKLPWEKAPKTGARPAAAAATKKPNGSAAAAEEAPAADDELQTEAAEVLAEILTKPLKKSSLAVTGIKALSKHTANRQAILALWKDDEFLAMFCEATGAEYDGETLRPA